MNAVLRPLLIQAEPLGTQNDVIFIQYYEINVTNTNSMRPTWIYLFLKSTNGWGKIKLTFPVFSNLSWSWEFFFRGEEMKIE